MRKLLDRIRPAKPGLLPPFERRAWGAVFILMLVLAVAVIAAAPVVAVALLLGWTDVAVAVTVFGIITLLLWGPAADLIDRALKRRLGQPNGGNVER